MDSEGVLMPLIHQHHMIPWNDLRKGDCCGRFKATSDGYYCKSCDVFVHKKCGDQASQSIKHSAHPIHTHWLLSKTSIKRYCKLCGKDTVDIFYKCLGCSFDIDLYCAKYPPPKVIENSEMHHHHKLILIKERTEFECDAKCGKIGYDEFSYKCHECDLSFHVNCVWQPSELKHPLEVNHSYHSLHPLKLISGRLPEYSDVICRLCGEKIDARLFYHCSFCNFTLDLRCVLHPPLKSRSDTKTHDHQLTLLPRLIKFKCNVCGLKGDRSPYICLQCDFVIHKDCFGLPRVININRHDHRVSRTSLLGVVNFVCGVCRQKVDWTCGGYSCERCPGYVFHSKCAIRKDVWNEKELEGVPEEAEDIEPYVVIDDNTIRHFSHKEHCLRLHVNGVISDDNKRCSACTHPICLQSFYGCIDCDLFSTKTALDFLQKNDMCYTMTGLL